MSKYNIDPELAGIAKIKMPGNPALLPLMNRIIGFSKCRSDDTVVITLVITMIIAAVFFGG